MRKKQKLIAKENNEAELWQPLENILLTEMRNQKAQGRLCDVVFIHGDVKIYSHACVLASCSPYLNELLCGDTVLLRDHWCIKTPLILNVTTILKRPEYVCFECFKNVIDYMYTDNIDMHKCHPKHVAYAAKSLQMKKLMHICSQYNKSEKTTTTLNTIDDNEHFVENYTSNSELAGLLKNGECSGNIYNSLYQEEKPLTALWKEEVSKFLPETKTLNDMNLKPAENSTIKKIESKMHDGSTHKSKSFKVTTAVLDINHNKENFAEKSNIILYPSVYDNNENITDECLTMTGQNAECRPNDNIVSRTNIMTKTLCIGTCNDRLLGCECNNIFSTPAETKILGNFNTCSNTVKLCQSDKKRKYDASINTKHSFYPNNCIQSNSLCERADSTNQLGTSMTTPCNEPQKLGCHENIGNSRINVGNANNSFTCDICQYKTSDLHKIVEHLEKNDHNQRHCTICTYIFSDNKEFKMHLKVHKRENRFLCSKCNRTFIRLSNFKKHLLKHKNEKPLICSICNATFKLQRNFHLHMRNKHHRNNDRFICEHCPYSALTQSDLTAHVNNNCICLSRCSVPNCGCETGKRNVNSILHNSQNFNSKTTSTATEILNQQKLENHFTDPCRTTESLSHAHVCNVVQFKCSYCNYRTPKEILYKRHIRKWHNKNKKSLNNPVYNMRNSIITLPTANNSSQLTGKYGVNVSERNSGVQSSIEQGLLTNNNSNSIDNKQMTNVFQHQITHVDRNEHNLLPMSNTEQLQKINFEEIILPTNNTQVTNIDNSVLEHAMATNDIVLLLNVADQNMYCLSPLILPSAKEQLPVPDDFQLTSSENSEHSTNLNNFEDNSCKRQDATTYSSNSFSIESLTSSENSGNENNIEHFTPNTYSTEEFSAARDLMNVTTIKNINDILIESISNELMLSRNDENELITNMLNNNSYNNCANTMFLDQEQSQSYLSGDCDPCMSDGIQNIFQTDLNTSEVTDNMESESFDDILWNVSENILMICD